MKIGDKIKILREVKNISAKEIADELEMTVGGYMKIERNDVDINTEKMEKIANVLGITPADLLNLDERHIFNFSNNEIKNGGYVVVNFPEELKSLYEDKIKLLEDKIAYQQETIDQLKEQIKKLS
ncbi:helix-turn-helix domain-containing protein [Sporocytophaga myxococcoides]|uniref:helix-turn-helix domain-containing protein n=1 Tax=Sporocytophaga myxococcoides TaxID=153721 RepID=UPI00040517B6|nr:helix-turn-helix transcriptional regulator [Sporocytophaga myxococcoides]